MRLKGAWTAVERADCVTAARRHSERTLVLRWPPYDDDAATGPVRLHRELAQRRVEYPREMVEAMPAALRKAFEASPNRIR